MGKIKHLRKHDDTENDIGPFKENMENPCKKRKVIKNRRSIDENDLKTKYMCNEMGLSLISESDDTDSCDSINENTPAACVLRATPLIPNAPRILRPSQRSNWSFLKNDSDLITPIKFGKKFRSKTNIEDELEGKDYISKLLDENILNIFLLLPRFTLAKCARVCKRWSRLVTEKPLWKKIDLSNKTLGPGTLGNIVHRGVKVLRLAKSEILAPINRDSLIHRPISNSLPLQYLDLSMAIVSTEVLQQLFTLCHDLKKLSLENCQLNDEICKYIGQNRDLETINFSMCQGITKQGLVPILTNCTKLESLNIGWTWLDHECIVYISHNVPEALKKLNWSGCRGTITDNDVMQLTARCKRLKELDLSDSTVLTCISVHLIADNLPELEHLALSRCYQIVPTTIPVLTKLKLMVALEVFGMLREVYLSHLQDCMPSIEINNYPFSSVARPTTGVRRTSIWGIRVRENAV